ncbi:NADP-dependent phosphogluconate dehydrogenase [Taibaiella koreensis]|uniref:NADP-dependent phosphogluconate dehydrogenase n=1 Tax=Taibaiella koreensis TaxID=1268548 RepID=UPI000E59CAC8|nr:NADP-dependent phosphogluconate dehydrogenase [Taibaiella koreensis]
MLTDQYDFGMIGLGTMGRNLLLNMADHGVRGAGYDKDGDKGRLLEQEANGTAVKGFSDLQAFLDSLKQPRAIMMLVPAGKIVDEVIAELQPLLSKGDILIDGGNSYFKDTERRVAALEPQGLHFFGMGISGGEEGARRGPSMMPGGDKEAYRVMQPILEAIAAKVDHEPCVTYIGPGAAGHFVKMVHNGIEYGLMQLIAETYAFMKQGLGMDNEAIGNVFGEWNRGRLQSFLLEITASIFSYREKGADHLLLDDIRDEARAKGTGKWTSQIAMDLEAPIPTIDIAVSMRDLSKYKSLREQLSASFANAGRPAGDNREAQLAQLEQAFFGSMVMAYTQGLHLLAKGSDAFGYELDLAAIARIWRGGCIIRSAFLQDIYAAFTKDAQLPLLLADTAVAAQVTEAVPGWRKILGEAIASGLAMPAYAASLSYLDSISSAHMPTNLIQAQRDYFGAHTYEKVGSEGVFHTQWSQG